MDLQGLREVGNEVSLALEPADDLLGHHELLVGSFHPVSVVLVAGVDLSQIHYLNPLHDLNYLLAQFNDRISTVNSVNLPCKWILLIFWRIIKDLLTSYFHQP